MTELVTNGLRMTMIARRKVEPLPTLGPRQQAWLESKFPGISRNRVTRLADHEKAAYAIAQRIDVARQRMGVV